MGEVVMLLTTAGTRKGLVGTAIGTTLLLCGTLSAQAPALATYAGNTLAELPRDLTFTRDVAPILQKNCVTCHRSGGVAPMSFETYEQTRPWASVIKHRTGLRDKMGAMPPWYAEKDIGIQHYKDDPSLTELEIATIAAWVDAGAPMGNPADMPPPLVFPEGVVWSIGEPDLVIRSEEIFMEAGSADWWGEITSIPTGLTEDRYVAAVEIKEVNDVDNSGAQETVGGRYIVHHMIWSTQVLDEEGGSAADTETVAWPVHEVGRNADIFDPSAGRLLKAGSSLVSNSVHLHSNGRDTRAHLEIGFKFHPVGYEPKYPTATIGLGNGVDIDIRGGADHLQELHAYAVLEQHTKIISFEPHLHAPGARMCLQAIWGINIETLTCAGYDHNWVRGYIYEDDYAPLLPKGTILHIVGYMDMSENNVNLPDPRNWQGSGNRSVTNMFIDLGMRVALTDEEFAQEMADRAERLKLTRNDHLIGCPLCTATLPVPAAPTGASTN